MRIVIDTRGENFQLPGGHYRLQQLFFQWALQHPEDEFCWLQASAAESVDLPNVQVVAVPELPRHWGRLTRWYLQELPKIWGAAAPDWLIPVPGFAAIGLDCPQALLWLHLPRYHFLEGRLLSRLAYRRALPKMLQTASKGWLNADGWASLAPHAGLLDLSNWEALPPVASAVSSSPVNEASLYEMDYHTGGRPFFASFITSDATEPVMNLMRAFSLFKKRQQTDWKLVIAGDKGGDHRELKRALAAYKYRDDTVLLDATTSEKTHAAATSLRAGAGSRSGIERRAIAAGARTFLSAPARAFGSSTELAGKYTPFCQLRRTKCYSRIDDAGVQRRGVSPTALSCLRC